MFIFLDAFYYECKIVTFKFGKESVKGTVNFHSHYPLLRQSAQLKNRMQKCTKLIFETNPLPISNIGSSLHRPKTSLSLDSLAPHKREQFSLTQILKINGKTIDNAGS